MSSRPTVRFLDRTTPPHIATLILLAGLSALSMNVFLPSLPAMTDYFDTDYGVMQLSVSLYLAVNAVLQVIVGPAADYYGRRPILLGCFGLFILATLGCIYSPSVEVFLTFRIVQAVSVVGMVLSRAVVRDMVPQDEAASMIGWVTMGVALVPMISPAIGGVLDGLFGWKANFWIQAILGAIVLWVVWADLGETSRRGSKSLLQQFVEYPELLSARRFWGYALATAFASGGFFSFLGGAPFVGSTVFGLSPTAVGLFFGAPAVGYALGNGLSGRYSVRFGINAMILWGALISLGGLTAALLFFAIGLQTPLVFFGFTTFLGIGNGMVLPNATSGMLSVRPHLAGTASGLGGAIMIGGGAVLSALAGAILTPETGAWPLLWLMAATSALAVAAIVYVIRRERVVAPQML